MRMLMMRLTLSALTTINLTTTACAELTKHAANGTYGCRRSFGYGVYNASANRTVVCWNGEKMSIYVREFDHSTQQWSDAVKACGLNYTGRWDYHNYPCIVLAPDGHYLVFYFKHSSSAYMLKSPGPNKIAGTWSQKKLSDDRCAYPMPAVVGNSVYLFYSSTAYWYRPWYRPYRMIKSSDNGKTWTKPITLIDTKHKEKEGYDEVYLHGFSVEKGKNNGPDRILLGWEMASGPNGHNKGGYGNFFAYFNCRNQKMYTAGGKNLGSTVDLKELYSSCVINDAKSPISRLFGYTTFPEVLPDGSAGVLYRLNGKAYIVKWEKDSWSRTTLNIRGGIYDYQRTSEGKYRILAGGYKDVTVWESSNGVSGWTKQSVTKLPSENGSTSAAMGFVDGFKPEVQWMVGTYNRNKRRSDYSGKWPIYTFGVKRKTTATNPLDSEQVR